MTAVATLFVQSTNPMLVADDERRYVDANAAACLFLRLSLPEIRKLKIDDLTVPDTRGDLDAMWSDFLQDGGARRGGRTLPWDLLMPDGTIVPVDLSATPHVQPGLHLAIILFPAAGELNDRLEDALAPDDFVLTKREREILTMVAFGRTGVQIASEQFLSPATVESHVTNALVKLGAKNRAHGIAVALHLGELDLDEAAGYELRAAFNV